MSLLELYRADIAGVSVSAFPIVEALDVVEHTPRIDSQYRHANSKYPPAAIISKPEARAIA